MVIALIGFMGSGKTTVGSKLSTVLSYDLIDLDQYIEEKAGRAIKDIFADEGEVSFRNKESAALEEVIREYSTSRSKGLVLACGGGTPLAKANASLIKNTCVCVWVRASEATLRGRLFGDEALKRPLLKGRPFEEILAERGDIYSSLADIVIDTDNGPDEAVETLLKQL